MRHLKKFESNYDDNFLIFLKKEILNWNLEYVLNIVYLNDVEHIIEIKQAPKGGVIVDFWYDDFNIVEFEKEINNINFDDDFVSEMREIIKSYKESVWGKQWLINIETKKFNL